MKSLTAIKYLKSTSKLSVVRKIKTVFNISILKSLIIFPVVLLFVISITNKGDSSMSTGEKNQEAGQETGGLFMILLDITDDPAFTKQLIKAFDLAQSHTGIDAPLLAALAITESTLNIDATNEVTKYKGIMQIPVETSYLSANILIGAKIFRDKFNRTNDVRKAIALYKGYGLSQKGLEKADAVMKLYETLKNAQ